MSKSARCLNILVVLSFLVSLTGCTTIPTGKKDEEDIGMKLRTLLFVCLLFVILPIITFAGEPPTTPFIRINTEMHSAQITSIAADSGGKLLATASFDKTVKVWESVTGKLIRTIRPPIGIDNEGTLNAVALSADGKSLATGGNTGNSWNKSYSVYIFDVKSGEMTHHIRTLPQLIIRLAYSPDDSRLAVSFDNNMGVSVFKTSDYKQIWSDNSFKGSCNGMDFDNNGNLVVVSDQGIIRMYQPDGSLLYEQIDKEKGKIASLKFSPNDKLLALGYYSDRNRVDVRRASDGNLAFNLSKSGQINIFQSVTWSADSKHIFAAGWSPANDGSQILYKWSAKDRTLVEEFFLSAKHYIHCLKALHSGAIAYVAGHEGFGVLSGGGVGRQIRGDDTETSTNGLHNFYNTLATADFRKNHYDSFKIAADASAVQFSYLMHGQAKAQFNLKNRKLLFENITDTDLISPRFTGNGIDIRNWENWQKSSLPRLNDKKLNGLWSNEISWSLAVRHDDTGFVLGGEALIYSYNNEGKLLWKKNKQGVAWDLNISKDNYILVAALGDSTIRWYRLDDGRELYALYLHPDRKRWVLWTPDGFFDHGPDSENLIGFVVNRGADKSSVMISVNQMYDTFYRPDIIDQAIEGKNISAYLKNLTKPAVAEVASAQKEAKEKERLSSEKVELEHIARQKVEAEHIARLVAEKEQELRLLQEQAKQASTGSTSSSEVASLIGTLVNSSTLPPTVRFITTSGRAGQQDTSLVAELCDTGGGIGDVTLFLNDMPVAIENAGRGLKVFPKNTSKNCINFERTISLQSGRNVITLMAYNKDNSIESIRGMIELALATTTSEKPQLHILTIAVNKYRDGDLLLKYAINDADVMARVVNEKANTLFAGVHIHKLHNADVTKEKLEAVFAEIGKQTKRDDVFLLFVAGHGITGERDGAYYFLPVDFRYTGEESIAGQGVSMNDFKKYLINIQAMKSLILIDTCNSGSFSEAIASRGVTEKTAITKLARAMGRATIVASSKNQSALEGYEGHGVFSYTVLEGLKGKASNNKGEITVNLLANFIEETLPELTFKKWGYEQIPQKSLQGMDFPIGLR
jgi:WD40 repeat protein